MTYNAGLGRYILATEHSESFQGNIGFFEAPRPWGPWKTVLYTNFDGWANTAFFWNFSNKWTSANGTESVLFFTGANEYDYSPEYEHLGYIKNALDSYNRVDGQFRFK